MSPMPSYNMDDVMATPERLSPSPLLSPGEILSPREVTSPGEAERVVPVDHVEDVINRVIGDVRRTLNNLRETREIPSAPPQEKERYITNADMENALQMMKLQIVTEIRLISCSSRSQNLTADFSFLCSSEARSLTPIIAMSLTNLAITKEKKDDLFSYKHQVIVTRN